MTNTLDTKPSTNDGTMLSTSAAWVLLANRPITVPAQPIEKPHRGGHLSAVPAPWM